MTKAMSHLVFDCDPGCDDAVAIAYILKRATYERIDFLTVAGNVAVEQTTENTRRILAACAADGSKFGIYRGCSRSLMADEPSAASVHGRDGLGEAPNSLLPDRASWPKTELMTAVEQLLTNARNEKSDFDLLCTGPLTNIATALGLMTSKERGGFFERCRKFVIMGGVFNSLGNITHSSEFNTFADPAAAQIVLSFLNEARYTPHFVSLDATEQVGISLDTKNWKENPADVTPAREFLRYALQQYGQFHVFSNARPPKGAGINPFEAGQFEISLLEGSSGSSELQPFCYLHDALAAWVLVNLKAFAKKAWTKSDIRVDVGRGESRGRIIICKDRAYGPISSPSLGTPVKWFQLTATDKAEFLGEINTLLGIETAEAASG